MNPIAILVNVDGVRHISLLGCTKCNSSKWSSVVEWAGDDEVRRTRISIKGKWSGYGMGPIRFAPSFVASQKGALAIGEKEVFAKAFHERLMHVLE